MGRGKVEVKHGEEVEEARHGVNISLRRCGYHGDKIDDEVGVAPEIEESLAAEGLVVLKGFAALQARNGIDRCV